MFRCSEEHEQLRAEIREFAENEIKPYAFQWDRENHFPRDVVEKMVFPILKSMEAWGRMY